MEAKKKLGSQIAQVVYEGKWFTPLREAIQAFVESTQEYVTGEVKFKLYKGNIIKAGTTSPCKLFVRSNRGVTLTPEGEKLFQHVAIAYEQLSTAESELKKTKV